VVWYGGCEAGLKFERSFRLSDGIDEGLAHLNKLCGG
jgi:hypothetical protein